MTAPRSSASSSRGLLVGAVFAVLALGSAWLSGGLDPIGQVKGPAAEQTPKLAAAAETPSRSPTPPAAAPPSEPVKVVVDPGPRPAVWRDVAARTSKARRGPLVIGLHGRGDNAENFARLAPRFPGALNWRFLQANTPFSRGFAWFIRGKGGRAEGISDSVNAIHQQVLSAGAGRPVALFGFSQGCMIILHYVVTHPGSIKAAACVGGSVVGALSTQPGGAARPPILFVNGAEDPVVSPQATRAAMQRVEGLGFPTEHIEHSGGHTVPREEINRIGTWLLTKLTQP